MISYSEYLLLLNYDNDHCSHVVLMCYLVDVGAIDNPFYISDFY